MNNKILGAIIVGFIIVISAVLVISVLTDDSKDTDFGQNQDYSPDDILSEIDEGLLDEDGEIEIGEMV
jgi:hypothetical protein